MKTVWENEMQLDNLAGFRPMMKFAGAVLPAVAMILLPKCSLCFAAYGSALAALGLNVTAHQAIIQPIVFLLLAGSAVTLIVNAAKRKDVITMLIYVAGITLLLTVKFRSLPMPLMYAGFLLMVGATLWNTKACRECKLKKNGARDT